MVSGQWSVVSGQRSADFIQKLFGVAWPQALAKGHATRMADS
ncbi:hypothetical protein [Moorena producens]